jgi:integrase/recombinase XerD
MRVSELCGLRWKDVQERGGAGQVTVYGKGGKTRAILLEPAAWVELQSLRGDAADDSPVFMSRKGGGPVQPNQVREIVAAQAKRAGLKRRVSPHWLRHSHASHAIDNQCPVSLVSATLGHTSLATTGRYLHARPHESSGKYLKIE